MRHLIPRDRIWRVIDARDQVLGRVAQQVVTLLLGKHKPYRTLIDNMNTGDPVIVINANQFLLTGRKHINHEYIHHSGYPGGLKRVPIQDIMRRRPDTPLRRAVYNMLPRNKLRAEWMRNLHIYMDDEHPHTGMKPVPVPPPHVPVQVKIGRAPDDTQMAQWWTKRLAASTNERQSVESLVTDCRKEIRDADVKITEAHGLAQLLDVPGGLPQAVKLREYVERAEQDLQNSAVVAL